MDKNDIQIVEKFENPYLNRDEYTVVLNLSNKPLPQRLEFRDFFSKIINEDPQKVIVRKLLSTYGGQKGLALVFVYKDLESKKIENEYVLLRHMSKEERKKILEERKKKKLEKKQETKK